MYVFIYFVKDVYLQNNSIFQNKCNVQTYGVKSAYTSEAKVRLYPTTRQIRSAYSRLFVDTTDTSIHLVQSPYIYMQRYLRIPVLPRHNPVKTHVHFAQEPTMKYRKEK